MQNHQHPEALTTMSIHHKLGVVGDVHCEDAFLALAIKTLNDEHVETIVCTGDLPTGPGDINACCNRLRKNRIATVRGNHDRWLLNLELISLRNATSPSQVTQSSWQFLESLPVVIDLATPLGLAQLCHGIGTEDMHSIFPRQTDQELADHIDLAPIVASGRYALMINGHSHHRMVRQFESLTIINAGTLRRDHNPCFAVIDFEQSQVRYWDILDQQTAVPADEFPIMNSPSR
jgi:predicted phosphodiesterase